MNVFMDTEGTPIQELSALLVNQRWEIVCVYHAYAACRDTDDVFCRRHLHGLDLDILHHYGFPNERELLADFERWLSHHPVNKIYANDPRKERQLFPHLLVEDIQLPVWVVRVGLPAYHMAQEAKRRQMPILGAVCGGAAHAAFVSAIRSKHRLPTDSDIVKGKHGFHCSLYDSLMIYLYAAHLVNRPPLLS